LHLRVPAMRRVIGRVSRSMICSRSSRIAWQHSTRDEHPHHNSRTPKKKTLRHLIVSEARQGRELINLLPHVETCSYHLSYYNMTSRSNSKFRPRSLTLSSAHPQTPDRSCNCVTTHTFPVPQSHLGSSRDLQKAVGNFQIGCNRFSPSPCASRIAFHAEVEIASISLISAFARTSGETLKC